MKLVTKLDLMILLTFSALTPQLNAQTSSKLSVSFENVRSSNGSIRATLCNDPDTFMRGCITAVSSSPAIAGQTIVEFEELLAGRYALAAWHDENNNGKVEIPLEGFSYGNNSSFPPSFSASSIVVSGLTRSRETMVYINTPNQEVSIGGNAIYISGAEPFLVRENGLVGELYLPPGTTGAVPAIISLSGSDGDIRYSRALARRFVDHGFAVLALAYWREPGLPSVLQELPLEYFDRAISWLSENEKVDRDRIGILGWSKGAEAALLTASSNPRIKAVVASSPTFAVWQGINFSDPTSIKSSWTRNGTPIQYLTVDMSLGNDVDPNLNYLRAIESLADNPQAIIPVENISGPILLLTGTDDRLWPAARMAELISSRLLHNRFEYEITHRNYLGAGHAVYVGGPDDPGGFSTMRGVFGGTPEADELAWKDSWREVLFFFNKHLK